MTIEDLVDAADRDMFLQKPRVAEASPTILRSPL